MTEAFKKVTIIGLGLIGSSIARAVRKHHPGTGITGADSNEISLEYARQHGFIDSGTTDVAQAVAGSDVIIIATPTHLLADICQAIAPHIEKNALVMDTGSVKQLPLAVMQETLPAHALIVPAHPIAGSEQSGVAAGREDLLEKKRVIITPEAPLSHEELHRVGEFWRTLGARVEAMPAEMHDTIYGYVSHLPQLLAFASAEVVKPEEALDRFLRISHSSRELWNGIFALNNGVLLAALDRYLDVIAHIRKELATAPADAPTDSTESESILFARIAASCLITTVMEAEKKIGLSFVRFAGTGFADFTSPATTDPEQDLAHISGRHAEVGKLLEKFTAALFELCQTFE